MFSDYKNRLSNPISYSKESQCLISVIEKGNRCILVIKDNKEFNFKLFNNEFIKNL